MTERVVGITMMKDEEDVAFHVIQHMAEEELDLILVLDNGSTDATPQLLEQAKKSAPCPVIIIEDDEVGYYQSRKMTDLAVAAADKGATWIVPFDADEVWFSHDDRLGVYLRDWVPADALAVGGTLWNHFTTDFDLEENNPFQSMIYRHPQVGALPKIAFRPVRRFVIEAGNHSVTQDGQPLPLFDNSRVELRHFPYRSYEQFRSKSVNGGRAYEATDLPHDTGAHWREYYAILQRGGDEALRGVYERWFHFPAPVAAGLVLDPAPFRRWNG